MQSEDRDVDENACARPRPPRPSPSPASLLRLQPSNISAFSAAPPDHSHIPPSSHSTSLDAATHQPHSSCVSYADLHTRLLQNSSSKNSTTRGSPRTSAPKCSTAAPHCSFAISSASDVTIAPAASVAPPQTHSSNMKGCGSVNSTAADHSERQGTVHLSTLHCSLRSSFEAIAQVLVCRWVAL
jgi:hypothetical protein